jgi:HTH-type transcriptional regulator / antitoxin HigA
MVVRPIRNDVDHTAVLRRIEELWQAPEGSEEHDELDVLATLVDRYEDTRCRLKRPTRSMFCAT